MRDIEKGDVVRVLTPENFISSFARKIRDRDAIVEWVGPDHAGMNNGMCSVTFLKRNGRGKEFRQRMRIIDLVLQHSPR